MILASWPPLAHWVFLWGFSTIVKGWTLEHHEVLPSPLRVVDCSFFCISMNVCGKSCQGHCKHTETIWSFENSHVNLHKSSSSVLGTGDSVLPIFSHRPERTPWQWEVRVPRHIAGSLLVWDNYRITKADRFLRWASRGDQFIVESFHSLEWIELAKKGLVRTVASSSRTHTRHHQTAHIHYLFLRVQINIKCWNPESYSAMIYCGNDMDWISWIMWGKERTNERTNNGGLIDWLSDGWPMVGCYPMDTYLVNHIYIYYQIIIIWFIHNYNAFSANINVNTTWPTNPLGILR